MNVGRIWKQPICKMMVVLLAALLTLAPAAMSIVSAANEADIESMKNSAVRIVLYQNGRPVSFGSGFVIDDGKHVVTNHHVIARAETGECTAFVELGRGGGDKRRAVVIRSTSRTNDIAVLQVLQKLAKPSAKLVHRGDIKSGEPTMAIGFPGLSDAMTELQDWLNNPPTPTPGQVVQLTRVQEGTHVIQLTNAINPGNSGGPVFNARGHVIGMATFGLRGPLANASYAVDADEIAEIVRKTDAVVEFAGPAGAMKPEPPANGGTTGGSTTGGTTGTAVTPPPPPPPPPPAPWYTDPMVLGGGALVLVILAVAGFMMSRSKQPAMPPPQMQMPMQAPMHPPQQLPPTGPAPVAAKPTMAAVKRSAITGVSGFFAGRTVELPAGRPMIIGRDPQQAQLVFPAEMSEISRVHCIITYDPASQSFSLEDRSTNGTFMVNGQRVSGQIKLRSGERFYLGEATNLFEVRAD